MNRLNPPVNSVLQSLHNISQFTHYFRNLPKIEQPKPRPYNSRSVKENLDEIFLVEELRKVRLWWREKFLENFVILIRLSGI
jgi:hypothetical protein